MFTQGFWGNVDRASQTTFYHRPEERVAGCSMIKRREHRDVIRKRYYVDRFYGLQIIFC